MNVNLKRVSDKLIHFHRTKFDESISPMKLQKLCYYAQGFHMALNDGNILFEDDFQAWQHGPVIKDLYLEYKAFAWKQIDTEIEDTFSHNEEDEFLNEVVCTFGSYDGSTLSAMTHQESPWLDARDGLLESDSSNTIISKESIYSYFQKQL